MKTNKEKVVSVNT